MTDLALEVRGLDLVLDPAGRALHVVRDLDLILHRAEVLGLIGESGSGKTMTGMALLRLEPAGARIGAKTMRAGGADLLHATPAQLRALRGRTVAMIFQDPAGAFNPSKRIAWHARQILRTANWRTEALALLADVDIADGARVLASYPHQLSGGMLQRVLIALVLASQPHVIVADEPTTNLDNLVEAQIMRLFRRLRQQRDAAFLFITHDMTIAAALCDRIAVMYAGEIVETADTADLFADPKHPYTAALIATARALEGDFDRLPELPGEPPALSTPRAGCAFAARCPQLMPACTEAPIPSLERDGRQVRCLLYV
jgi:oligopeptide/dipeptide ABC transporter ATP-binding protein